MRVLFVCLGNICRSPSAEGVFREQLRQAGLADRVEVDSCGIGHWHVGKAPDRRAQAAAGQRGIDLSALRARMLEAEDFERFDYILAMDHDNLAAIEARRPAGCRARIDLFLSYAGRPDEAVPDPYFGGDDGFEHVLDLIEAASRGLIDALRRQLSA
ncbi:low molecular weight protein-tyrosine-phosphatase [Modicisalibacter tunisiensis]|uniref:protein-tyrosine-phosphatase n=1 Tax=Modicisalibacter tunisiensis TaxID=390637 RepID=A0ABS7X292_9GAMM|nr:low molecular weight protein-tyrosine-phosphatase [Modicisalibacter tunisiensis]MBZ9538526.1 low molecular weight phosphotyrosine protein phosphatase [Modicisalibacter tunisiensis]MBZ9568061.1 low molecular weight phosphotyrosine protein phosphatase [Modicisalibacter tunisiensis]